MIAIRAAIRGMEPIDVFVARWRLVHVVNLPIEEQRKLEAKLVAYYKRKK